MSLINCLTCGPVLDRTDSDTEGRYEDKRLRRLCGGGGVERSWSGNLASHAPLYESMRRASSKNLDKGHHRHHRRQDSSGGEEPKLIRSGGMRRDWSFENLKQIINEKKRLLHKP